MNTLNTPTHRLICAAFAAATTLVLFSAVTSISEPQRSTLMALQQAVPVAEVQLAAASAHAETVRQ